MSNLFFCLLVQNAFNERKRQKIIQESKVLLKFFFKNKIS